MIRMMIRRYSNYLRSIQALTRRTWRLISVALVILAAFWFCYAGVLHALASHYGDSLNPDDWYRASRIESTNAENWERLGRYRQLDLEHADIPLAIGYFGRAVQLNPKSPYDKDDLASALEMGGSNEEAEKYYRAAEESYPASGEVSWKYGNFLLRQQRLTQAYAEIHRAVVADPKLLATAISLAWRSNPDVGVLLGQVLPDSAQADWATISYLTSAQQGTDAVTVWKRLAARRSPIDIKKVFPLVDLLIAQELFDDAETVWRQAVEFSTEHKPLLQEGSLVFDGGFESNLFGAILTWQHEDVPGAQFNLDTDEKHSGARSVSITFDGTQNPYYTQLHQDVIVSPNRLYHFRGFLRTDKITTESGMRFEIFDPIRRKDFDVSVGNETGTHPWTPNEVDFLTGPATRLVQINLLRVPSTHLANALEGTVWVDDVSLCPVTSAQ